MKKNTRSSQWKRRKDIYEAEKRMRKKAAARKKNGQGASLSPERQVKQSPSQSSGRQVKQGAPQSPGKQVKRNSAQNPFGESGQRLAQKTKSPEKSVRRAVSQSTGQNKGQNMPSASGKRSRAASSAQRKPGSRPEKRTETKKKAAGSAGKKASKKRAALKRSLSGFPAARFLPLAAGILIVILGIFLVRKNLAKLNLPSISELVKFHVLTKEDEGELVAMAPADPDESAQRFQPSCTENTQPSKLIAETGISVGGEELADESSYVPQDSISFGQGKNYTEMEGVLTFRGNNFRDMPAYGTADIKENVLKPSWSHKTGSLSYEGAVWTGNGWTGQPLLIKWPQETKQKMNMQDWAKQDENLVEVIYPSMDGFVYFLDLETGKETREALELGYTFKGAGALDPRGYPILYVGAGYNSYQGTAHVFVVNLLDGSVMYEFGDNDPFSLRGSLSFFDSSALVDAETDTLIYPGENGILYLIRLNTAYDPAAGTLSISPSPAVKWHYYGTRSSTSSFWVGMEDSAAVYGGYLFIADNGGNLMCLNLNTLQLVWVQDVLDDSNSTPVLSMEDGHLYIYVSTSFRLGWRSDSQATIPVWKIDAENGEIVWQKDYECYSDDGVSGGVQSTIALGKNQLSDYIYVTVSRVEDFSNGVLACIDKKTGAVAWEHKSAYAWSSPVCVYDSEGKGKVIYCDSVGKMFLLDGKTGQELHSITLDSSNIEASPSVYDNHLVVGTRGCNIFGVELR